MTRQDEVVDRLVARGWRVDTTDATAVYLSKRGRIPGQTLLCQVDADGDVGGHEDAQRVVAERTPRTRGV